jgi:hypothetical protein
MKLREAKRAVRALNFRQLVELDVWLHGLLEAVEHKGIHEVMKYSAGHKTYRSEMVRCGKKICRCAKGNLHGPYWYAYWSENGKTRSQYVGKHLPKGVKHPRSAKPRRV